MSDNPETTGQAPKFDVSAYPPDTLFYDRRTGLERRLPRPEPAAESGDRRQKKERRRRIDPTTFEKQYSPDEMEFMTAMQEFKVRSAKAFPTYSEVLAVARSLGYHRPEADDDGDGIDADPSPDAPALVAQTTEWPAS